MSIYRGTTPTLTLEFDTDLSGFTLYFEMKGTGTSLTKTNCDMVIQYLPPIDRTIVYIPLTQDDTLRFRGGTSVRCQMRAVKDNYAIASDVDTIMIEDVLKDGRIYDLNPED